jgi:hypothetical protein
MVCENRVQMQWHSGMLIFFKRWKDFAIKVQMEVSDMLVFKYKNIVFLMQMYYGTAPSILLSSLL